MSTHLRRFSYFSVEYSAMESSAVRSVPWAFWLLIFSVLVVLGQSLYKNYVLKDYIFYVEASCDASTNECYSRSCENEDDCPPSGLEEYRAFELPAHEFKNCIDNSCTNICPSEEHSCIESLCSSQSEIACVGPGDAASE